MRWKDRRRSDNVEDRRSRRVTRGGGIGVGAIVLGLLAWWISGDPRALLGSITGAGGAGGGGAATTEEFRPTAEENERADFISVVLADTEDVWNELFRQVGKTYREPRLVLFSGAVQSACGFQSAAVGPFYCPGDSQVYLDLSFFDDLERRFGAPGDFAQAYVIAHEVGHHIQNLLGISDDVRARQRGRSKAEQNDLSVRLELQADFLAGVWAHHAQRATRMLEQGDLEEALNAAAAIGDDRLQRRAGGTVVPESFTHGTSAQRMKWFRRGLETGDLNQGDTFSARDL
ncbi:MAG: neutral zinc metallopeptidase [Planctomycetota bacterium JB042]